MYEPNSNWEWLAREEALERAATPRWDRKKLRPRGERQQGELFDPETGCTFEEINQKEVV